MYNYICIQSVNTKSKNITIKKGFRIKFTKLWQAIKLNQTVNIYIKSLKETDTVFYAHYYYYFFSILNY